MLILIQNYEPEIRNIKVLDLSGFINDAEITDAVEKLFFDKGVEKKFRPWIAVDTLRVGGQRKTPKLDAH